MNKTPYPYSKNGKKAIAKAKKIEQNAVKKPIAKIDKNRIYAWILLVLMAFWTFASVVSLVHTFGGKSSMISISAGAEGVDYNEMTIDPFQYPTANLLNWPYDTSATFEGGVTWLVNEDGTLTINGSTATLVSEFYINRQNVYFFPGATYSFSFTIFDGQLQNNTISLSLLVKKLDGTRQRLGTVFNQNSSTFVVPNDTEFIEIALYVQPNITVSNVTFGIMYNQGSTAYPYQPPYQLVYENGFNVGIDNGYQDGFDTGKLEGIDIGKAGIFAGLVADCTLSYYENSILKTTSFVAEPLVRANRVDFSQISHDAWQITNVQNFDTMSVSFIYQTNYGVILRAFSMLTYDINGLFGPDDYDKTFYINTSKGQVPCKFVLDSTFDLGVRKLVIEDEYLLSYGDAWVFGLTGFSTNYIDAFLGFEFFSTVETQFAGGYQVGYVDGYNAYMDSQQLADLIDGVKKTAFEQGRVVGYEQGVQNKYSFFSLLSAVVDAPLQMFKDMFNFELLGVNLSDFALGLLTVAMVLGVVKLIL